MIKDPEAFEKFENEFIGKNKLSYSKSVKLFQSMWDEGVAIGVLPPSDPLEGIETDIKVAKIINSCFSKP